MELRILFLFSIFYFLFSPGMVRAAEIYFGGPGETVGKGDVFEIGVFLNTDGETLNAMEGEIVYDTDLLAEAKAAGTVRVTSREEWILRHDEEASSASVRRSPFDIRITETPVLGPYTPLKDSESPESFSPIVAQNPELFGGEGFAISEEYM